MIYLLNKIIRGLALITLGSVVVVCLEALALIFWDATFIDIAENVRDSILKSKD